MKAKKRAKTYSAKVVIFTPAHREKISDGMLAYWKKRKALEKEKGARMSDIITRLTAMRDRIDELAKQEQDRAEKLETEVADMEIKLALAAALTALKKASFDARDRPQAMGAKALITKVLAA